MPEVVVATPDANGKARTWDKVFPIWNNDDEKTEWRMINQILEAIAMNNRFGSKTPAELKEYLHKAQHDFYVEQINALKVTKHDHKKENLSGTNYKGEHLEIGHSEFGCACDIPEDRQKSLEKRADLFRFYGQWMYYIEEVFANYAGAYREYK